MNCLFLLPPTKTLSGDKVSMFTHIYPHKPLWKWPIAITRLTTHFTCGLMSGLVICEHRKLLVIHNTKCPYWDQVSINNPRTPNHKNKMTIQINNLILYCLALKHFHHLPYGFYVAVTVIGVASFSSTQLPLQMQFSFRSISFQLYNSELRSLFNASQGIESFRHYYLGFPLVVAIVRNCLVQFDKSLIVMCRAHHSILTIQIIKNVFLYLLW